MSRDLTIIWARRTSWCLTVVLVTGPGPPEGYGPGVWFYEPAGARHEETQRVSDEDLIYTANVYGPLQFDEGVGTPIIEVLSWMQYKELAAAAGVDLVHNTFEGDSSLMAWSPIGSAAN